MKTIGVCRVRSRRRSISAPSNPSMPGIRTSSRMTAYSSLSVNSRAWCPVAAAPIVYLSSRRVSKARRLAGWSSTIRTRGFAGCGVMTLHANLAEACAESIREVGEPENIRTGTQEKPGWDASPQGLELEVGSTLHMKILLSSASATARKILRGILEKAGHAAADILEATNRKTTVAALTSAGVDLAVVDWDLPNLDVAGFVRELRDSAKPGKPSVLFCVKPADRAAASEVAALGPYDWIARPFTDESFRKKIRALRKTTEKPKAKTSTRRLRAIASGKDAEFSLPFLLQLPSSLIDQLLKRAVRSRHAPGTVLLEPGDIVEYLHIVTRGEVEILEGSAGIGTRVSGEGDPFGELSFMTAQPSPETVRAHTEIDVASVSKAELTD